MKGKTKAAVTGGLVAAVLLMAVQATTAQFNRPPQEAERKAERAEKLLEQGKYREAHAEATESIFIKATVKALLVRGRVYMHWQQYDEAYNDFTMAHGLSRENTEVLEHRVHALVKGERFKEALEDLAALEKLGPRNPRYPYLKGLVYWQNLKDLKKAMASFNAALRLNSGHGPTYLARARMLAEGRQMPRALSDADKAVQYLPESAEARFFRAGLLRRKRKFDAAAADYREGLKHRSKAFDQRLALMEVLIQGRQEAQVHDEAERCYSFARGNRRPIPALFDAVGLALSGDEHADEAAGYLRSLFERGLRRYDFDTEGVRKIVLKRGDVATSRRQSALKLLDQWREAHRHWLQKRGLPRGEEALINHALAQYLVAGKKDEAFKTLDTAAEKPDATVKVFLARAYLKGQSKMHTAARRDFDEAIKRTDTLATAWFGRAIAQARLEDLDKAIADMGRAIKLNDRFWEARYQRGRWLVEQFKYDEALSDYNQALAVRPSFVPGLTSRGVALCTVRRYREALSDFKKAVEIDLMSARSQGLLAQAMEATDKQKDALDHYSRAIKLSPRSGYYQKLRGDYRFRRREYTSALGDYDLAVSCDPEVVTRYIDRGNCYLAKGDYKKALADYKEADKRNFPLGKLYSAQAHILQNDYNRAWIELEDSRLEEQKVTYRPMGHFLRCLLLALEGGAEFDAAMKDLERSMEIEYRTMVFDRSHLRKCVDALGDLTADRRAKALKVFAAWNTGHIKPPKNPPQFPWEADYWGDGTNPPKK